MRVMSLRRRGHTAALRISLGVSLLMTATMGGQTSPTFQLKGDSTELTGTTNGSVVLPTIGPTGTLVVGGTGGPEFAPVGTATGVAFRQGGLQVDNTSYYSFGGPSVGTLFGASGGDVNFYLKSRYSFAQRKSLGQSRYVFDVYDASQNPFTFYVATYGGYLMMNYRAGGVVTNTYYITPGQEDVMFGSGVTLKVRMKWDATQNYLYLNDVLVDTPAYSRVTPNWTAASSFLVGAKQDLTYGPGYLSCDDWISQFLINSAAPPAPPGKAVSPSPANGASGVATTSALSWGAASGATKYDVYFGKTMPTTPTAANVTSTTFTVPGGMTTSTTYVWRIDSKNSAGTTAGDTWSFTTAAPPPPPTKAASPSPANASTNVPVNSPLSWAPSTGATSYDVYFGTTLPSAPTSAGQTGTSYTPSTLLAPSTQYFWKVNAKNSSGTTVGDVWSFTTSAAPPPPPPKATNPSPAILATNVAIGTSLTWTGSSQATSYDLYLGTTLPTTPTAAGLTAVSFTPSAPLAYNTTYSWRVDSKNSGGTTLGDVWTFTTSQPPGVVSITVNPTGDSSIHSIAPTSNYGSADVMTLYDGSSALFQFSLPAVPSGYVPLSAKLQLNEPGYDDFAPSTAGEYAALGIYRLTRPWTESGVTYNKATATTSWTSPGGDYDATTDFARGATGLVAEALSRLSQTPELLTYDVTALVTKWYQNVYPNNGFLLRQLDHHGGPMVNFRENVNAPALVISYIASTTAPTVAGVTPLNGASGTPVDVPVTFNLNDPAGIDPASLSLVVNGVQRGSEIRMSGVATSPTLTYTPAVPYAHGASVTAALSVKNRIGNTATSQTAFTTAATDTVAPAVTLAFPGAGSTNVPVSATFLFKLIDRDSGVDTTTLSVKLNGTDITSAVQLTSVSGGYQLNYTPAQPLPPAQTATFTLSACDKAVPRNCLSDYTNTVTTTPVAQWYRGNFHQHTGEYSADATRTSTISTAASAARSFGDQFLVFNQHQYSNASTLTEWTPAELQNMAAAETALGDGGFATIGGQEVFTNMGHALLLGVPWDKNPREIYDMQDYARSTGGVFAFAHPEYNTCPCVSRNMADYRFLPDPLYMAAYSAAAWYTSTADGWHTAFGFVGVGGFFDQMLSAGRKLLMYGESDYHDNPIASGPTVALVYGTLSPSNLMDAIRSGRLYVTNGPDVWVDFNVNGFPSGSDLASLNSDVSLTLNVSASITAGTVDQVIVVRDNSQFFTATPATATFTQKLAVTLASGSRSYLRVIVVGRNAAGQTVKAASNPIYIGSR